MKKLFLFCLALIVMVFFSGCGPTQQSVPMPLTLKVPVNKARIILTRPNSFYGSANSMLIKDQNIEIGRLANGGKLEWDRPPGKVVLKMEDSIWGGEGKPLELEVEAGKSYNITANMARGGFHYAQYDPYETAQSDDKTSNNKPLRSGTGFYASNSGHLLTNAHVVQDAEYIKVINYDKTELEANLVAIDPVNDVALLKVDYASKALPIALTGTLKKGQEVLTLGYPLIDIQGHNQKATFGNINSLSGVKDDLRMMQIDVPLQGGNSGGPLITNEGAVVGIATSKLNSIKTLALTGDLPENINYAVKSDYIVPILNQYLSGKWQQFQKASEPSKVTDLIKKYENSVVLIKAK